MKTALILIAPIDRNINPSVYFSLCANRVKSNGYTCIHSTAWQDYQDIDLQKFSDKVIKCVDVLYLFVDFGVTQLMYDFVNEFYVRDENGFQFIKEIRIETISRSKYADPQSVLEEVSGITGIPIDVLKMKTRKREIVTARFFYFKRAKLFTKASLQEIGNLVGKDHATVMHGLYVVDNVHEVKAEYNKLFSINISKPEKITKETKSLLIGKEPVKLPFAKRLNSPFEDVMSCTNQPYSGYKIHQVE
jgi:hypothetical protein